MDLKTERGAPADWQPLFGILDFYQELGKDSLCQKSPQGVGKMGKKSIRKQENSKENS